MPRLPTYTAQLQQSPISGGRRATGEDFASIGPASGHDLQRAADAYLTNIEQEEARKVVVASSDIRARYARAIDEAALSGGDLDALKQKMNDELSKVGENFETKRGADHVAVATSNLNLDFDQQANRIAVTRARATATTEAATLLRNETQAVAQDPASLKRSEEVVRAFFETYAGRLPPEMRKEMAEKEIRQLHVAAAMSTARLQPELAKQQVDAGKWDLTIEQRTQVLSYADSEIRGRKVQEEYERTKRLREDQEKVDAGRANWFDKIYRGQATWAAIRDDPAFASNTAHAVAAKKELQLMMETRRREMAGEEKRSDPAVLRDAWSKVVTGEWLTNAPVVDLVNKGQLNTRDGAWLTGIAQQQKNESGESWRGRMAARLRVVDSALKGRADYSALAQQGVADDMMMQMVAQAEKKAEEYRKENDKAALDGMLDPDSKFYFFTPGKMKAIEAESKARVRATITASLPKVTTQAEYDALPSGAQYVDSNGTVATKKGGKQVVSGKIKGAE